MKLFTSSWFTELPVATVKIGISRGVPRRRTSAYRLYQALAPGSWFSSVSEEEYVALYRAEVLGRLDPRQVVADLQHLSEGADAALVCFEKPEPGSDYCHRALVALWLYETVGLEIHEYGVEGLGFGHPKMPKNLRTHGYGLGADLRLPRMQP
jgi:hypothetical protein